MNEVGINSIAYDKYLERLDTVKESSKQSRQT